MRYAIALVVMLPSVTWSGPMDVYATAVDMFDRLPTVQTVADLHAACGSGARSNPNIGYCATHNVIFVSEDFAARPAASYEMAHVLGHAIQVRHGVADVALREIRNRRDDEVALRGMVTRQVDCVAGVLMVKAGEPAVDWDAFAQEPFTDAHWGRRPIDIGPRVSIGTQARADWFNIGYHAIDFAACSVGEISAELIVDAQN